MLQFKSHFLKNHWWQVAQQQLKLELNGIGSDWKLNVKHCNIWLSSFSQPPSPSPSLHFLALSLIDFPREMKSQALGFPAEWDWAANAFGYRVVVVGFGKLHVCTWRKCIFILSWPVRFSFDSPEPLLMCLCVRVDKSYCTFSVSSLDQCHFTCRTWALTTKRSVCDYILYKKVK